MQNSAKNRLQKWLQPKLKFNIYKTVSYAIKHIHFMT